MRVLVLLIAVTLLTACERNVTVNNLTQPSDTPATPVVRDTFEFRVNGNATSVRVRYSTPTDGTNQIITSLPFSVVTETTRTSLFLTIEVAPVTWPNVIQFPFLSAQIFVNGTLFREASSSDYVTVLQTSGTWRK